MSIRILIADDHKVFRSGLRALLEKEEDLEVVAETGTGPDTVTAVLEKELEVLLLDLSLPGMTGSRVAEAVLKEKPHLPIVVLTMHEEECYLQELIKIGVKGFVLKKSTSTDVIQAVRAAHRGEQYIDPFLAGQVFASYVGGAAKKKEAGRLGLLTPREQEITVFLSYGHTSAEIAEKLSISERTVETHRLNLMTKLGLKGRAELVRFAIDNGLLKLG